MPSIDLAIAGNHVAGLDQHDVARPELRGVDALPDLAVVAGHEDAFGPCFFPGAPQGLGLCTPPAFGDRLGEIGKQHGEPEPGSDLAAKQRRLACHEIASEEDRHERRYDGRYEDHGVLDQRARIELAYRVEGGAPDQRGIGDGSLMALARRTACAIAVTQVQSRSCEYHGIRRPGWMCAWKLSSAL